MTNTILYTRYNDSLVYDYTDVDGFDWGHVVFGDGDMWKLLCKYSSQSNRMMKSTKALEIKMVGCLVQVTTVENGLPSEAITFVPNTVIVEDKDEKGNVINRRLEASPYAVR
jgi:hypothetical protein